MQYTRLGDSGLIVSRLAFGTMTFTQSSHRLASVYKVGAELADELVGCALDAGVNFFDTADVYANGESERILGAALKPHRDKVILATKVGFRSTKQLLRTGLSRRHIMMSVDESLQRLGTDWIDLYIAHREDPFTPLEETLEAFDAVVRAGKVRYLGFSNWSAWQAAAALEIQKANGLARFTHGQLYYSLLGRETERDMVPMMRRYGLGMTVWSPLAYGFLSGAYSREDLSKPDNRFSNFDMLQFDKEKGFALLDVMRGIAAERGCTVAQVALAWLLSKESVTSILLGATKLHQLEENLGVVDVQLTNEDLNALDTATALPAGRPSGTDPDDIIQQALIGKR
jgi:aryl-alcohol dehydrogenase-like predicted oxidoreductase